MAIYKIKYSLRSDISKDRAEEWAAEVLQDALETLLEGEELELVSVLQEGETERPMGGYNAADFRTKELLERREDE